VITYVQFVSEVPIGGEFPSISYYSADKHAKTMQIEERGSWIIVHLGATVDGKWTPNGKRRRVPITNVVSISEEGEVDKAPKLAKGTGSV
jgi:hypothetical protein